MKRKQDIDSRQLISEMNQMLRKPKLTMENMIFSDINEDDFENEEDFDEPQSEKVDDMDVPNNGDGVDVTDTINKIRQLSLQAIAKLADNPTSEQYQLLKKVWNLVDKSFETKDNKVVSGE